MNNHTNSKILFIINPASGTSEGSGEELIRKYMGSKECQAEYFIMPHNCLPDQIKAQISIYQPDKVVASGGDGTIKLVAECLANTGIPLGILASGSANGLAKELRIPPKMAPALDLIMEGKTMPVSMVCINDEMCIHLADIGFNAFVVKKFEAGSGRGMWGYFKASFQVLRSHYTMTANIMVDKKEIRREAAMIVIANATRYGSGAVINPKGRLDDDLFEVIIVKKISLREIFKMMITHNDFDPTKTEVFQANSLKIHSRKKAHFQVDGEYLGKTNHIQAIIMPQALQIIVADKSAVTSDV